MEQQYAFEFSPQADKEQPDAAAEASVEERIADLEANLLSEQEIARFYHERVGLTLRPGTDREIIVAAIKEPAQELDRLRAIDKADDEKEIRATYRRSVH